MTATESRVECVKAAIHSGEIDGLTVSDATRAGADSFVACFMNADELVERVCAQHGLTCLRSMSLCLHVSMYESRPTIEPSAFPQNGSAPGRVRATSPQDAGTWENY